MVGSVSGAAESTLEFAELVGDVSKTLASKANIVGYDAKDDPFSDQYNWASWNLGKDELGAQTPVGKIAQGFGEFGVTFMATGGGLLPLASSKVVLLVLVQVVLYCRSRKPLRVSWLMW